MIRTIALIAELSDEQSRQLLELLENPGDGKEMLEALPTETLKAFQKIFEAAIEERKGKVTC